MNVTAQISIINSRLQEFMNAEERDLWWMQRIIIFDKKPMTMIYDGQYYDLLVYVKGLKNEF